MHESLEPFPCLRRLDEQSCAISGASQIYLPLMLCHFAMLNHRDKGHRISEEVAECTTILMKRP